MRMNFFYEDEYGIAKVIPVPPCPAAIPMSMNTNLYMLSDGDGILIGYGNEMRMTFFQMDWDNETYPRIMSFLVTKNY